MIDRYTMFKQVGDVLAQCVVPASQKEVFEGMGFVDHTDKLNQEPDIKAELVAKAKELGIARAGNMSVETLEAAIAEKENDSTDDAA